MEGKVVDSVKIEHKQLAAARKVRWPSKHEMCVKGAAKGISQKGKGRK